MTDEKRAKLLVEYMDRLREKYPSASSEKIRAKAEDLVEQKLGPAKPQMRPERVSAFAAVDVDPPTPEPPAISEAPPKTPSFVAEASPPRSAKPIGFAMGFLTGALTFGIIGFLVGGFLFGVVGAGVGALASDASSRSSSNRSGVPDVSWRFNVVGSSCGYVVVGAIPEGWRVEVRLADPVSGPLILDDSEGAADPFLMVFNAGESQQKLFCLNGDAVMRVSSVYAIRDDWWDLTLYPENSASGDAYEGLAPPSSSR